MSAINEYLREEINGLIKSILKYFALYMESLKTKNGMNYKLGDEANGKC